MSDFTLVVAGYPQLAAALDASGQFSQVVGVSSTGALRDAIVGGLSGLGPSQLGMVFADSVTVDTEQTLSFLLDYLASNGYATLVVDVTGDGTELVDDSPAVGLLTAPVTLNVVLGALSGMSTTPQLAPTGDGNEPLPMPGDQPVAAPQQPEPAPAPQPAPQPEPAPAPQPEPAPAPANPFAQAQAQSAPQPAPQPEPAPAPQQAPSPAAQPAPAPQQQPDPAQAPQPGGAPNPFSPAQPSPTPQPAPDPQPAPAPAPQQAPNPFAAPPAAPSPQQPAPAPAPQQPAQAPQPAPQQPSPDPFGQPPAGDPFAQPGGTAPSPFGQGQGGEIAPLGGQPSQHAGPQLPEHLAPDRKGVIVSICAPKGGVGKSGLALNLAAHAGLRLRQGGSNMNAAVVDANVQQPDVGKYANRLTPSIADLGKHRGAYTPDVVGQNLVELQEYNLHALLGPPKISQINPQFMRGAFYQQVVGVMQEMFDLIVVDTPVAELIHDMFDNFVLKSSDYIVCVAAPNSATLHNVDEWLQSITDSIHTPEGRGYSHEKVGYILNRAEEGIDCDIDEVRNELGRWRMLGAIPESKAWKRANNHTSPVAGKGYDDLNMAFDQVLHSITGWAQFTPGQSAAATQNDGMLGMVRRLLTKGS